MASCVLESFITNKNLYSLLLRDKSLDIFAVTGIVNSRLISYVYLNQLTQAAKDDFPQVTIKDINALPFPSSIDKARHDKMVKLVEQMLAFNQQLASAKIAHGKTILQCQIAATDQQIDNLVYELYGLTEEEIKVVENRE